MAYASKIQMGGVLYDVAPPSDLTEAEKAEYRSRIGAGTGGEPTAPIVMADVTISQNAWSNGEVTITSSISPVIANVTENSYVQFYSSDASANVIVQNNIRISETGDGSVTFLCDTVPTVSVNGMILIFI